jgi:hypothetical protein
MLSVLLEPCWKHFPTPESLVTQQQLQQEETTQQSVEDGTNMMGASMA